MRKRIEKEGLGKSYGKVGRNQKIEVG